MLTQSQEYKDIYSMGTLLMAGVMKIVANT